LVTVFLLSVLAALLMIEGGYRAGLYMHRRSQQEQPAPVGGMVAAVLALLAFLMAFTFGLAANIFQNKRQVILEEANAIGTAYLRADLLTESHRGTVRDLLREYVEVRLEAARSGNVEQGVARSEELHALLWAEAMAGAADQPGSPMVGLFIQALNEVIDLHAKRIQIGVRTRIPETIWYALLVVAAMGLGSMGYQTGLTGSSRSIAVVGVALAFSIVIWLIADLDRTREGMLKVSQQAMFDLQRSIGTPNGGVKADPGS
jgi:uncharacterized membrane protein